jgi:DNA replication protein DnaC
VINPQTKTKLEQLKLESFIDVFQEIISNNTQSLSLDEALTMMVDREVIARDNRRLSRLLKAAKLRYPSACIAHIDYQQARQFEHERLRALSHCQWIAQHRNCILTGPAGIGKSYIACALGHQACQLSFRVRYYRVPRLVEVLRMSHADGSYSRTLERLAKIQCLILDDWGIDQLDRQARRDLLEVLEDRYAKSSTIITTQLPVENWHQFIGDDTIADAICDRVINNAVTITMTGDSMRKAKNLTHVEHTGIS